MRVKKSFVLTSFLLVLCLFLRFPVLGFSAVFLFSTDSDGSNGSDQQSAIKIIKVFKDPGEHKYSIPSGVSKMRVRVWGAGASASSSYCVAACNSIENQVYDRAAGPSGGYAEGLYDVSPGDVLTIKVGRAGSGYQSSCCGGTYGCPGRNGEGSYVYKNGSLLIYATGGSWQTACKCLHRCLNGNRIPGQGYPGPGYSSNVVLTLSGGIPNAPFLLNFETGFPGSGETPGTLAAFGYSICSYESGCGRYYINKRVPPIHPAAHGAVIIELY